MKRLVLSILVIAFLLCTAGCGAQNEEESLSYAGEYTCDFQEYPTTKDCMGYGKIKEIEDGKLLIAPGSDEDKIRFGEVAWLVCDDVYAYSVGQVVTYTFRDVKAPDTVLRRGLMGTGTGHEFVNHVGLMMRSSQKGLEREQIMDSLLPCALASMPFSDSSINSWASHSISLRFNFLRIKCIVCIIIHT